MKRSLTPVNAGCLLTGTAPIELYQREVLDDLCARCMRADLFPGVGSGTLRISGLYFRSHIAALVHSSARTGELGGTLSRHIVYKVQSDHAKKEIVSASIYQALLLSAGTTVMQVVHGYVVPKFSGDTMKPEETGHSLSWLSRGWKGQ